MSKAKEKIDSACDWPELHALGLLNEQQRAACEQHLLTCAKCRELVESSVEVIVGMADNVQSTAAARTLFIAKISREQPRPPAAAKPEALFDLPGLFAISSSAITWQAAADGVWVKTLFEDKEREYRTSLVKLDPGARYPAHRHAAIEEAYMLEGDLHFDLAVLRTGDYCRAEAGSIHSPSHSESGCILLVTTSLADELLA